MTATLLDFSQRPDLALHAEIIADIARVAEPLDITPLIVGAFARDPHLLYGRGIETLRQTEDLDFALAVPDWSAFDALQKRLIETARFSPSPTAARRLRHRNGFPIDLVPFGSVETRERKIAWPPRGEFVMDVFGLREAQAGACDVLFPGGVRGRVVSLPALALLKIVCWRDRHYESPRKDAHDLLLIMKNDLLAGNEARLFDEFFDWTQEETFDHELADTRARRCSRETPAHPARRRDELWRLCRAAHLPAVWFRPALRALTFAMLTLASAATSLCAAHQDAAQAPRPRRGGGAPQLRQ